MGTGQVFEVGNRKQLFIDSRFFAQQFGMQLVVNPPIKTEIVLEGETPWETNRTACYATVLQDDGVYKLWYDALVGGDPNRVPYLPHSLCYATSTDGLHWERQNVNLYDWYGHKENNIVMPGAAGSVMLDPKGPDEHRFKALGIAHENEVWPESLGCKWDLTGGAIHLWTSPDGIHWRRVKPFASPFFHDTLNLLIYDDRIDKYVAYVRTHERNGRTVSRVELDDPMQTPWPCRPAPADMKTNEHGQYLCMTYGGYDMVMACDEMDPPDTDVQMATIEK